MTKAAVVFDANAYEGLPGKLVADLAKRESEKDILACADSWVTIELIAKLVDQEEQRFARAALTKLWRHCGADDLRMVADCEEQVCRLLFGRSPQGHADVRARIRDVIGQVADMPPDVGLDPVLGAAGELREHVDSVESERARTVLNSVIRQVVPDADSWDAIARRPDLRNVVLSWIEAGGAIEALAMSEVRRAHIDLGLEVPDPLPADMIDSVLQHFRYPLEVDNAAIRAVIENGADPTTGGRENSIWDAQIASNAGQTLLGTRVILLVTDDTLLHRVATQIGQQNLKRLKDYLADLKIAA